MKMKLTDAACRVKPRAKPFKLSDGGGMFLLINPSGARAFRLSYRFGGKQKTLSLGPYPAVSLIDAREARTVAKANLAKGIDPAQQRKEDRLVQASTKSFGSVCNEWFAIKMEADEKIAPATALRNRRLIDHFINDPIGAREIGAIEPPELLAVLRVQEAKGFLENATRLRSTASLIFRFGISTGVCKRDPAADLAGALTSPTVKHRPAITDPVLAGKLFRDIAAYEGGRGLLVRLGMQFLALTFVRPGEQRKAEWAEFDTDAAVWVIPASKMKMRLPHEVPLSHQLLAILAELRELTGTGRYVFSTNSKPMSEGTIGKALRKMGYDTQRDHCAHGFRSTFSTLTNGERGKDGMPMWHPDVVELALAHVDDNSVRAVYNRAKLWPERVRLMQHWADRIDTLRDGAKIMRLKRLPG